MAVASANLDEKAKRPGKIGAFLGRLFGPFGRRQRPSKRRKSAVAKNGEPSAKKAEDTGVEAAGSWPPERLDIIEKLWGEGCTSPSSARFLQVLLPLLGLSEKKSLLLLGAGLGGLGRAMVDATGVWVTGYETDRELVELARDLNKMAGMQKRAPVSLSDFEKARFKKNSFNTEVSLESLYRVAAKEQLYAAIAASLRVDGELMMTDFVLPDDSPPNRAVEEWSGLEAAPPNLWTAEKIHSCLASQNMNAGAPEDITAEYRNGIFKGFFGYLSNVTKAELLETSGRLIAECEHWVTPLSAIDSGGLKVFKFHAFKLPEKRKRVY